MLLRHSFQSVSSINSLFFFTIVTSIWIIKLIRIAIAFLWIYVLQCQSKQLWKSINFWLQIVQKIYFSARQFRIAWPWSDIVKHCPLTQTIRFRPLTINKKKQKKQNRILKSQCVNTYTWSTFTRLTQFHILL